MRAYIIVDLGFGDSGKGLLTDFLVRQLEAGVVVRYNGGAQAGHNVVTLEGHHHTFSQFGSGTFLPHVKTYLSRHVVIHPTALLVEGDILAEKGIQNPFSRLRLSDQALVITPFHQAANRIREIVRGASRHGSCGVGVGEAVEDALSHPENRILAGDLNDPALLRRRLRTIREQKQEQLIRLVRDDPFENFLAREYEVFQSEHVIEAWIRSVGRLGELGLVVSDSVLEKWLQESNHVIFEGAQGVLLDADAGFHPFTTWSRCTAINAFEILNEMAPGADTYQIGLVRSYAMRHGPGPLPTETDALASIIPEHNTYNEWQGAVRYGWFDAVLARYALDVTGKIDILAVTHMDVLSRLSEWKYCHGYQHFGNIPVDGTLSDGVLKNFRLPETLSLPERAEFTQALSSVTPVLGSRNTAEEAVIQEIENLLGQQVGIISRGPSAENVQLIGSLPS